MENKRIQGFAQILKERYDEAKEKGELKPSNRVDSPLKRGIDKLFPNRPKGDKLQMTTKLMNKLKDRRKNNE